MFRFAVMVMLSASWPPGEAVADIMIDGYTPITNDRFNSDRDQALDFIAGQFDLSGIAQNAGGWWATAISRNVIITAAHAAQSGAFYFYPGNDPLQSPVIRNVIGGTKVGSTDLYVGVLNQNLPDSITHYQFATEALNGTPPGTDPPYAVDDAGIYQGMNAYLFGRSQTSHPLFQNQAVGRNLVSGYSENVPFSRNLDNDSLLFARDTFGDVNYETYEAMFQGGDSGGPTFVEIDGELRLIGTNAFIYGPDADGVDDFEIGGIGSGINYTGNQATFIQNYIMTNAVPEPSTLGLVAASCMLLLMRRPATRMEW